MIKTFQILEKLGEGGMGEVYRARIRATGVDVALKVLRERFAHETRYRESFNREVRAIGALNHPGIVRVLDYGTTTERCSEELPGLSAGSLWLAMELAQGALEDVSAPPGWPHLRRLLLEVLDALAHSHARGIIHRDLKPANVLWTIGDDNHVRWMLSDYGIAHIQDPSFSNQTADIHSLAAGTPTFMAPEQLHGHWRDYGPWTDLYALGCMAYLLASGRPPFEGDSLMAIAMQHLTSEIPPLPPRLPLPQGFENWVRRLLARDVSRRYRSAADAARGLLLLGDPGDDDATPFSLSRAPLSEATTEVFAAHAPTLEALELPALQTALLDTQALEAIARRDRGDAQHTSQPLQPVRVPGAVAPPPDWRSPQLPPLASLTLGLGKGLFGIRDARFIGRQDSRDLLWHHLQEVHREGCARALIIRAEAGLGKTRLMDWLATRAEELGVATALRANHSPIMSRSDGLPRMLQTFFRATGLSREKTAERIQHAAQTHWETRPHSHLLDSLADWLAPDHEAPPTLSSPLERYTLLEQTLQLISSERPIILCLDDVQWGLDALGFALHALNTRRERNLPLLIVATLRPEGIEERLAERQLLELLSAHEHCTTLHLDHLQKDHQRELVRDLLGLENGLVTELCRRTRGNPLFAVQLIEDWVHTDQLHSSPSGYVLAEGAPFEHDLQALLTRRINALLQQRPDPDAARWALEVAAALGIDVDEHEWHRICDALDLPPDPGLLDALMIHGIAGHRPGGWHFRLPLYRDVIESLSAHTPRWPRIHRAAASVLAGATQDASLAERRARHLLAAHAHARALPLLWQANEHHMLRSAYLPALAILERIDRCHAALNLPDDAPERPRVWIARAEAQRYLGHFDHTRQLLERALALGDRLRPADQGNAFRVLANLENFSGHSALALQNYRSALLHFERAADDRGAARCLHGLGWILAGEGDITAARQAFAQGHRVAERSGQLLEAAWCVHGIAETHLRTWDPAGLPHAQRAHQLFDAAQSRSGLALSLRTLGDFARYRNDLPRARDYYRQARHLATSIGHVLAGLVDSLIAFCDLTEGKFDDARRRFQRFSSSPQNLMFPLYRPVGPIGGLVVAAHDNRPDLVDRLLTELEDLIDPRTPLARDFASFIEQAADQLLERGHNARAARALGLAADTVEHIHPPQAQALRRRQAPLLNSTPAG
ncbi:hypothetical protein DL240_15735 [Lujinxingia litoralis]|uniref:Protein kinase domain-containing protein n=1 Tax=Lujinxingia litoralis TaxID=2211119 RepID=A0A328C625_9DELT|nr:serine/threonine-protein kinase [Lujinxingia litoralis]RAL20766.1 hypothetical protein DL240_15735 [Lujinxingia litoralis]